MAAISGGNSYHSRPEDGEPGVQVRDQFAAMILQGLVANPNISPDNKARHAVVVTYAVELADALIAALHPKKP